MNTVVATFLLVLAEGTPEAKDVKAGWLAFWIFMGLVAATALLCWSFVRQLRKAQAAKDAGVYGDTVADPDAEPEPRKPQPH